MKILGYRAINPMRKVQARVRGDLVATEAAGI